MLTAERLRAVFYYNGETGQFIRRVKAWGSLPGTVCGSPARKKRHPYLVIRIDGQNYFAHRLAWLYVHGAWPSHEIDHINRDVADNRIANLRVATSSQNHCNSSLRSDNTVGLKGVSRAKQKSGFRANIKFGGKAFYLGTFPTAAEAHSAYCAAAHRLHGEFARTS